MMNRKKLSAVSFFDKRRLAILLGTLVLSLSVYATPTVHAQFMTATTVSCNPTIIGRVTGLGSSTVCTATVTSTSGSPPTGFVDFMASGTGTFRLVDSCQLGGAPGLAPNQASCSVTWTALPYPGAPTQAVTMTAQYRGDMCCAPSGGSTVILVLSGPLVTTTTVVCGASTLHDHKSTRCTATVSNLFPVPPPFSLPPTGTVSWECVLPATFPMGSPCGGFTPPSCLLSSTGANSASCSTIFTAMAGKPTTVTIIATYSGDMIHSSSRGTTTIIAGS